MNQIRNVVSDPLVEAGVYGTAGATLASVGGISLAKNEKIRSRASKMFLAGSITMVVGLVMLISGILNGSSQSSQASTFGTVVKIQEGSYGTCLPTVEFQAEGQDATTRTDDFEKCVWEVGDKVPVTYEANSGGTIASIGVQKNNSSDYLVSSLLVLGVGFVLLLWGIIPVAVRAGSVFGGFMMIREGFKKTRTKRD